MSRSMINYSAESELMQFQLEPPQNEDQQQSQSQQQEAVHQGTEAAPSHEGIGPHEVSVAVEINAASQ